MRSSDITAGNAYARRGVHTVVLPGAGGLASFAHNGEATERLTELVLIEPMLSDPLQNILFDVGCRAPVVRAADHPGPEFHMQIAHAAERFKGVVGMREDGEIVVPSHGNGHNFHFRIALDGLDELFHDRRKGQTVRAGVGEEVMNDDRLFGEFQRRTHLDVVFAENGIRSGSEKRTGKAGRANGGGRRNQESARNHGR